MGGSAPHTGSPGRRIAFFRKAGKLIKHMIVSTKRQLTHADLCRYEELLHGHRVHVGEVLRHKLLAIVPVAWRKEKDILKRKRNAIFNLKKRLTEAIVLLKIDGELSNHDRVLDVRLNPL